MTVTILNQIQARCHCHCRSRNAYLMYHIHMASKEMKYNSPKVWSCGNKHCPHDCYWPTTFSYTTDYEHYVWGSDNKFRSGADNCGRPKFLFHWELQGKGAIVTPKHCHKPVLKVEAGTALKWRISTVGLSVRFFQPAFPSSYTLLRSPTRTLSVMNTESKHARTNQEMWTVQIPTNST